MILEHSLAFVFYLCCYTYVFIWVYKENFGLLLVCEDTHSFVAMLLFNVRSISGTNIYALGLHVHQNVKLFSFLSIFWFTSNFPFFFSISSNDDANGGWLITLNWR